MSPMVYTNIFSLICLLIFLNGCHGQDGSGDDTVDCRMYRLQQYFCVARCISFVREDAPSSQVSYKGSCTSPPTFGAGQPTSPAEADTCKSSMDFSPLTGCCTKDNVDDFFIDSNINECVTTTSLDVKIVAAVAKDYVGNKAIGDNGAFDGSKIASTYGLALDCLVKKLDLYSTKSKLAPKETSDYLGDLVKKTYKSALMDIIGKCTASTRGKGDEINIGADSGVRRDGNKMLQATGSQFEEVHRFVEGLTSAAVGHRL